MGSSAFARSRRAAGLVVLGALLFSLPACGNRLPKDQLLADNRLGAPVENFTSAPGADLTTGPADPQASGPAAESPANARSAPLVGTARAPASPGSGHARTATSPDATAPTASPSICAGSKSEIAIGTVGGQSGFIGAALHQGVEAIKAWVAAANAKGGIRCHPIRYYVADDDSDPSKNAALTQQMIEDRHVIAMVYSSNPLSAQGGKPLLERAHVPTIGSEGGDDYFNTSPDFFPVAATGTKLIEANYGMLDEQLTSDQKSHLGVLTCIEAAICANFGGPNGTRVAEKFGMKVVYSGTSTMVQPDYTSNCQSAKNAGVQAFFTVGDGGFTSRIIRSCAKIGFQPQFASSPVAMAPGVVGLPELDGILLGTTTRPWIADDPVTQDYLATLAKYVPGAQPSGSGSVGWAIAMMFERVTADLPENPVPQDIYNGLWRVKNLDFGGYTAPLTYTKGKAASYPTCWWTMSIRNKQWTSPNGSRRGCSA